MGKAGIPALSAALVMALVWACSCPQPAPAIAPLPPDSEAQTRQEDGPRTALVAPDHPDWVRVEAARHHNRCKTDDQCYVGGCEAEICSAQPGLLSACETKSWPSRGGLCGCVAGNCIWYGTQSRGPEPR